MNLLVGNVRGKGPNIIAVSGHRQGFHWMTGAGTAKRTAIGNGNVLEEILSPRVIVTGQYHLELQEIAATWAIAWGWPGRG